MNCSLLTFVQYCTIFSEELNSYSEIENVERLWNRAKQEYKVETYLETYLKVRTKFAKKFKNDQAVRQTIWDRLNFKETCPK